MLSKKRVKQNFNRLQSIKTWQLIVLFILACFIAATLLRLNNIGMVERREAVRSADKAGDAKVIQERLYDLQRFVSSHMNTDMGNGISLEATYRRDYDKALGIAADSNPNGNIYKKAQEVCVPRFQSWSQAYVQCTANELAKYPPSTNANPAKLPHANLYHYSFASPLWSPDFAGWSVIVCGLILIMILARLIGVIILKIMLSRYQKSI